MTVHVHVDVAGGSRISLEEATDCRRLDVRTAPGVAAADVAAALRVHGAGRALDDEHVLLSVAWLREAALAARPAADPEAFDAMVEYAAEQGWCTVDGYVRAHLEQEQVA